MEACVAQQRCLQNAPHTPETVLVEVHWGEKASSVRWQWFDLGDHVTAVVPSTTVWFPAPEKHLGTTVLGGSQCLKISENRFKKEEHDNHYCFPKGFAWPGSRT